MVPRGMPVGRSLQDHSALTTVRSRNEWPPIAANAVDGRAAIKPLPWGDGRLSVLCIAHPDMEVLHSIGPLVGAVVQAKYPLQPAI
jgi:hypothetical protein